MVDLILDSFWIILVLYNKFCGLLELLKLELELKLELLFFTLHFFIFSFQNGLNDPFSSTSFYFKSKVIEGSYKGEICSLLLGHLFSKYAFLGLWHFFLA